MTETWLTSDSAAIPALALPLGYKLLAHNRPIGRGGGLTVICRDIFNCSLAPQDIPDCENPLFQITLSDNFTFTGLLIYRPPGPAKAFQEALVQMVSTLALKTANFSILGNLNLHLEAQAFNDFLDDLEACQLSQLVKGPSHQAGHLLDSFFSNLLYLTVNTPLPLTWTDHFLPGYKRLHSCTISPIIHETSLAST